MIQQEFPRLCTSVWICSGDDFNNHSNMNQDPAPSKPCNLRGFKNMIKAVRLHKNSFESLYLLFSTDAYQHLTAQPKKSFQCDYLTPRHLCVRLYWVCMARFGQWGGYRGSFLEKLLEVSLVSDRDSASQLQDGPTSDQR